MLLKLLEICCNEKITTNHKKNIISYPLHNISGNKLKWNENFKIITNHYCIRNTNSLKIFSTGRPPACKLAANHRTTGGEGAG